MKNLLPIGRFSQITRLTVKALRHYDELGLLRPAFVDSTSGYRYYNLTQAKEAERISILRMTEMPLEEIRRLLASQDPAWVRTLLDTHRQRIELRMAEQTRALQLLQRLVNEEQTMSHPISLKRLDAQYIVSIRTRSSTRQLPELFGQALGELHGYIGKLGVRASGPVFSSYHDPEFKEDDIDIEIALPVERRLAGNARIQGRELAATDSVSTVHTGPYDEVGRVYRALMDYVQANGYELSGPPREIYLVGPGQVDSSSEYKTEVVWPIVKSSE